MTADSGGHFLAGAVLALLALFTGFLFPALLAVGAWASYRHAGIPEGGHTATHGVLWVSAWLFVIVMATAAVTVIAFGAFRYPVGAAAGALLLSVAWLRRYMTYRGGSNGPA